MKLDWTFDDGKDDPDYLESALEAQEAGVELEPPEPTWDADWWPGGVKTKETWHDHLSLRVTETQDRGYPHYLLCVTDYTDAPADKPWLPTRLPTLMEFPTLSEAQRYAQQVCDDMEEMR